MMLLTSLFLDISYNQPKFSPCAAWDSNAATFASGNITGSAPQALFVNAINTVFMINQNTSQILVWPQGSPTIAKTISDILNDPKSLFASANTVIYVDTGFNRVDSRAWTANTSFTAMNISGNCDGLFIDSNSTLYCSISSLHQVVKLSLKDSTNTPEIVAGGYSSGLNSYLLTSPRGIFVDLDFNLYVADCGNNRVQRFHPGQVNATTVAGNSPIENLPLDCPTAVVLDADDNLFIVDNGNHRIIEVTPNTSRCVVGCSGNGSSSSQLSHPTTLSFDSYGNIFVTDQDNDRIQKFSLATNSCGKCKNNLPDKITHQILLCRRTDNIANNTGPNNDRRCHDKNLFTLCVTNVVFFSVESSSHFFIHSTIPSSTAISTFHTTLVYHPPISQSSSINYHGR